MDITLRFVLFLILLLSSSLLLALGGTKATVHVFHKQKAASIKVLEQVNPNSSV